MSTKPIVPIAEGARCTYRRGFTIRELAVALVCLLVAVGLLTSLAGANRDLSQASVCASNLETLFGGLMAYVNTYNSFPPHNPYPRYTTEWAIKNWYTDTSGMDPNIGWIMTYGLAMTPPATYTNGHFKWFVLNETELPSVCTCPAANYTTLFTTNPEMDFNTESFLMQYAAFYQTSGTCRAATPVIRQASPGVQGQGGTNPVIPDPSSSALWSRRPYVNCMGGTPSVWVWAKASPADDPDAFSSEENCSLQATQPSQVDNPSRVYYLADSREFRPSSHASDWPPAGISSGWYNGWGNLIYLGTRHYEYANVMYLDGQVNRDNQAHPRAAWNMDYDWTTYQARSSRWWCATFADPIEMAAIGTQHHIMPQLNIKGWERFFNNNGVAAR